MGQGQGDEQGGHGSLEGLRDSVMELKEEGGWKGQEEEEGDLAKIRFDMKEAVLSTNAGHGNQHWNNDDGGGGGTA